MKIIIDGERYTVDGAKVMEHLRSFYVARSSELQVMDVGGKKIDFGKKSLLRIGVKTALVPLIIPMITLLYKMRGLEAPKHTKHEDMLDWMVCKMLEFGAIIEKDITINARTATLEDSSGIFKSIETVSTYGTTIFPTSGTEKESSSLEVK